MQVNSNDARRHSSQQHLARKWIDSGGVVVVKGISRTSSRPVFDFSETIRLGAALQVTFNIREISKACKFLSDYSIYLWNCDREGEYWLCGRSVSEGYPFDPFSNAREAPRPYRKVAPTCYAGQYPNWRLDIYDVAVGTLGAPPAAIVTRMLLPRGLCAAISQARGIKRCPALLGSPSLSNQ